MKQLIKQNSLPFSFIKKHGLIIVIILALLIAGNSAYLFLTNTKKCNDFECFQKSMESCAKAKYINEELEASWKYEITGKRNGECKIDVKLLQAKEGDLDIDKIKGQKMSCFYPLGSKEYPERNLEKCTGKLRESLQSVVIKRLHIYIIENIGEIKESLKQF